MSPNLAIVEGSCFESLAPLQPCPNLTSFKHLSELAQVQGCFQTAPLCVAWDRRRQKTNWKMNMSGVASGVLVGSLSVWCGKCLVRELLCFVCWQCLRLGLWTPTQTDIYSSYLQGLAVLLGQCSIIEVDTFTWCRVQRTVFELPAFCESRLPASQAEFTSWHGSDGCWWCCLYSLEKPQPLN